MNALILQDNYGSSTSTGSPCGKSGQSDSTKRFISPLTISEPRTQSAPPTPHGAPAPFRLEFENVGSHKPDDRQAPSCADVATLGTTKRREPPQKEKLQSASAMDNSTSAGTRTPKQCHSSAPSGASELESKTECERYLSSESNGEQQPQCRIRTRAGKAVQQYHSAVYHVRKDPSRTSSVKSDPFPVGKEKSDESFTSTDQVSSTEYLLPKNKSPPCDDSSQELSSVEQLAIKPATCMSAECSRESTQQQVLKEECISSHRSQSSSSDVSIASDSLFDIVTRKPLWKPRITTIFLFRRKKKKDHLGHYKTLDYHS